MIEHKPGKIDIFPRPKARGVKWHMEPEHVNLFIEFFEADFEALTSTSPTGIQARLKLVAHKLGKKCKGLLIENPNLLAEKSPDEIKAALDYEVEKATAKLKAISVGLDWKGVKVEKPKAKPTQGVSKW